MLGPRSPEITRLRRLTRRRGARLEEGAFVLEGPTLLEEALAADAPLEAVFAGPGADETLLARAADAGVPVHRLSHGVVERVADAVTPQPVLAVARTVEVPLGRLRGATFVVAAVDVRDPGNAGTIVRTAAAAGADGVVVCGDAVDVRNPKVVRASAGALFRVPVVTEPDAAAAMVALADAGLRRLAAVARGGTRHDALDLTGPVALVVGNEAAGLSPDLVDALDGAVTIPMAGATESLNVAVATAVLCFEVARQRQGRPGRP